MDDVLLNYKFLLPCTNQTYGESSMGHFCSTGYPDMLFGCNQTYSIYVPFGYAIEVKLNVSGMTTGAFCQNNTFQVVTRDESHLEKRLLSLCLDCPEDHSEMFALRTSANSIDFRIPTTQDSPRRGFCASYNAVPIDSTLVESCPYGWTSGEKFCYKVYGERVAWSDAERACQRRKGHLASITDSKVGGIVDQVIKNR